MLSAVSLRRAGVECGVAPTVHHASSNSTGAGVYEDVVTYECDYGFIFNDTRTTARQVVCDDTALWSDYPPSCSSKYLNALAAAAVSTSTLWLLQQ